MNAAQIPANIAPAALVANIANITPAALAAPVAPLAPAPVIVKKIEILGQMPPAPSCSVSASSLSSAMTASVFSLTVQHVGCPPCEEVRLADVAVINEIDKMLMECEDAIQELPLLSLTMGKSRLSSPCLGSADGDYVVSSPRRAPLKGILLNRSHSTTASSVMFDLSVSFALVTPFDPPCPADVPDVLANLTATH